MQKIVIKQFGPIKEAEIEIDKVLLLIGEQASGKSTTAKLIYFFRSLPDLLLEILFENYQKVERPNTILSLFIKGITQRFLEYFGLNVVKDGFVLEYTYTSDGARWIRLTINEKRQVDAQLSSKFRTEMINNQFKRLLADVKNYFPSTKIEDEIYRKKIRRDLDEFINNLFGYRQNFVFYPAGKSFAINYSDSFKFALFGGVISELQKPDLHRSKGRTENSQSLDLNLLYDFLRHSERIKDAFRNHDLMSLVKSSVDLTEQSRLDKLHHVKQKIVAILKGDYYQDASGEKIYLSDNEYVYLSDASSGQQEAIRLVQDLFLILLNQENAFRIIEEPEAHLWPMAQKHLFELMAIMVNETDSQLVITTHSPYTLSVFNNLLYATHVAAADPESRNEIAEVIRESYWLNPTTFNAYMLKDGYCQSIVNRELGLIGQNFLDQISEKLGDEFDQMYGLHAKVYA
ncbi:MAG: AAA family ATPase [Caldilineaceae bacterium]